MRSVEYCYDKERYCVCEAEQLSELIQRVWYSSDPAKSQPISFHP
jgi:hypothetical protein